jgi:hypothetical protein
LFQRFNKGCSSLEHLENLRHQNGPVGFSIFPEKLFLESKETLLKFEAKGKKDFPAMVGVLLLWLIKIQTQLFLY